MNSRNPRPTIHRFSVGGLLGAFGLLLVLYFTVANIAEARRELAASKDSLAKISANASVHRLDRADRDGPYATRPSRHANYRLAHASPTPPTPRRSAAPFRPADR